MRSTLKGTWNRQGLFLNGKIMGDTLYTIIPNRPGQADKIIYAIQTDSGRYNHVYNQKTSELIEVRPNTELEYVLFEFEFKDKGTFTSWSEDKAEGLNRITSQDPQSGFKLLTEENDDRIIFKWFDNQIDTVNISELNDHLLILDWGGGYTERYIRD